MKKIAFFSSLIFLNIIFPQFILAQGDTLTQGFEIPSIPGRVKGTGTYFEINDSQYLNITLDSVEPLKLVLESIPEMITMWIESTSGASSTQITLSGFLPLTTYHKYEDDYHQHIAFTTDADGNYTYLQDLSSAHFVFIQPRAGTKFIKDDSTGGDCNLIGTWDAQTKTCTLTTNSTDTIQIDSDNITLNGNGQTITGDNTGSGLYLYERNNITIKNLIVKDFAAGILLASSSNNTLTGNTTLNNFFSIPLLFSNNNSLNDNNVSNNNLGIYLYYSDNTSLNNNNASNNGLGVNLD